MRHLLAGSIAAIWAIGPAGAHGHYTGIFNFAGINCCTGQDCQRAWQQDDFMPVKNGYRIKSTGEFVPIPATGFSPDQFWHICRKSDSKKTVRCLLVPPGGV